MPIDRENRLNILFVCSRNQWRSPTAEKIFGEDPRMNVKSAGTSSVARVRVSEKLLEWADCVMVMERKHRRDLERLFPECVQSSEVVVLDIPDDYQFMDEELITLLRDSVDEVFE